MPHDHTHGGCGHDCEDHAIPEAQGHRDNLYTRIDKDNIVALNAVGAGADIIKPWHERMHEGVVGSIRNVGFIRASHNQTICSI